MNIKEARLQRGISQQEFAKLLGVSAITVWRYEAGVQEPSLPMLRKISQVLSVPLECLIGGKCYGIENVVMIPVVDKIVSASAGFGNGYDDTVEWQPKEYVPMSTKDLQGYSWQTNKFYAMYVDGDSMEPQIHDGDKVIFAQDIDVHNGDVAVIKNDGVLYVKAVLFGKNKITLVSLNKNYRELEFDLESHQVDILGKVICTVSSKKVSGLL